MKRTKIDDRELPVYSRGEEIFNMTSHIVGAGMALIVLIACIAVSVIHKNWWGLGTGIIFGVSMIVMYIMSSIYHGLSLRKARAKKILQVIDHDMIFVLIAGSYTPFALCTFRPHDPVLGWSILLVTWGVTALGVTLTSIDWKKYRVFSMICYIAMGWCIIVRADLIPALLGPGGTILLVAGGIAYTIGAILYGVGVRKKWMHSIFHLFILVGSLYHSICILLYVL